MNPSQSRRSPCWTTLAKITCLTSIALCRDGRASAESRWARLRPSRQRAMPHRAEVATPLPNRLNAESGGCGWEVGWLRVACVHSGELFILQLPVYKLGEVFSRWRLNTSPECGDSYRSHPNFTIHSELLQALCTLCVCF